MKRRDTCSYHRPRSYTQTTCAVVIFVDGIGLFLVDIVSNVIIVIAVTVAPVCMVTAATAATAGTLTLLLLLMLQVPLTLLLLVQLWKGISVPYH